jgi:glycosyltransferase involved in cell wall biosynthesis
VAPPMARRVLYVSKPIAPPFHDGTKCLVRDLSLNLRRYRGQIMTTPDTRDLGYAPREGHPGLGAAHVYRSSGGYTPTLAANARAAAFLVAESRADLWHFVFAPNPRTSAIGRMARAIRRIPVVQTVASAPRRFESSVFFGDIVVAQSTWTRDRIVEAFEREARRAPRVEVIPPPIGPLRARSAEAIAAVRHELGLPDGAPVLVYPGDLEVSHGAETVAAAVEEIARELPGSIVVFACRAKTARAPVIEAGLRARLAGARVRFVREVDLPALLGASSVVLFPVDDLWGKVDLPISLLEAMRLGVPVVALNDGPLADLAGAIRVPARDPAALAEAAVALVQDAAHRAAVVELARAGVSRLYDAGVVAAAYERLYDDLA